MRHRTDQFEEIFKLIQNIDVEDAIIHTRYLRDISKVFNKNITDDKILSDLFDFLNKKALLDDSFVIKLVSVMSSRQMEAFNVNGKIIRHAMLEILQKNFQSADHYKADDMNKFYNSIKLLGEYFNKAKISNGNPINILGQSLLNLINVEIEKELRNMLHFKNDDFSEIILTQMALNGNLLKTRHKIEIELVLMNIRKCLIEINMLSSKTKAFLIMTLDLYYSNFNETNLAKSLEKVYQPYLLGPSSSSSSSSQSQTSQKESTDEKPVKTKTNGRVTHNHQQQQQPTTSNKTLTPTKTDRFNSERRLDRTSSAPPPRSPLKTPKSAAHQRRSEPIQQFNHHQHHSVPTHNTYQQKKISPKELRTRQITKTTSPILKNDKSSSSKALFKVESAIDKLQIKSSNDSNQNDTPTSPLNTHQQPQQQQQQQQQQPQDTNDENILKQQNTNGNSLKSKGINSNSKVYFKEENVENLSWNADNSFGEFEDPDGETSPRANQYSSSFLNFLSNN